MPRASSLIVVPLQLIGPAGMRMVTMILDTGASGSMISPEVVLDIGCRFDQSDKRVPIITASSLEFLPVATIPAAVCMGHTVRDLEVVCHHLPAESTVQGLLGLDFLRHVPAFQQFEKKILELTRS